MLLSDKAISTKETQKESKTKWKQNSDIQLSCANNYLLIVLHLPSLPQVTEKKVPNSEHQQERLVPFMKHLENLNYIDCPGRSNRDKRAYVKTLLIQ